MIRRRRNYCNLNQLSLFDWADADIHHFPTSSTEDILCSRHGLSRHMAITIAQVAGLGGGHE